MSTELIVIDEGKELEFFGIDGADKALEAVKEHLKDFKHNIKTATGRKEIASMASKIGKSRKLIDDLGAKVRKDIQNSKDDRKTAFDKYQAEFRKPLTDWEETEGKRISGINDKIKNLNQYAYKYMPNGEEMTADALTVQLKNLEAIDITKKIYSEFTTKAENTKLASIEFLAVAIGKRKQYEDDQADLARLREKEANEKHEPDVLEVFAETNELADPVVGEIDGGFIDEGMSENIPVNSPSSVSEQLEPVRHSAPISRTAPSDRENKRTINNEILAAVIKCGFTEEQGKNFVAAMVSGGIPHITVNY